MTLHTRRTIATGAAWAVPLIAIGAAAPAASASTSPPPVIVQVDGLGCKEPGRSVNRDFPFGYRFFFDVTTDTATTLTAIAATLPGGDSGEVDVSVNLVPGTQRIAVTVYGATNSANGDGTVTFSYGEIGLTITVDITFGDFPPCKD
jgi:hypothetical protein